MKALCNRYLKIMAAVNCALEWLLRIILAFMVIVVFTQVLSRFFQFSMPQLEELARYCNIYMAFLALAYGMSKDSLVKVDAIQTATKGWLHNIIVGLASVISVFTCGLYVYSGIKLVEIGIGQKSSSMHFDLAYIYAIIPIGCGLAILNTLAFWLNKRKEAKEL